ncbi:hypothetical protein K439DRAFT_1616475 [Ramaria rubella]|nr:hypothetical protein K439DRAFT_1616475 [Ramaria rubella]
MSANGESRRNMSSSSPLSDNDGLPELNLIAITNTKRGTDRRATAGISTQKGACNTKTKAKDMSAAIKRKRGNGVAAAEPVKKKGRKPGAKAWHKDETWQLLNYVEEVLPISGQGWGEVTKRFNQHAKREGMPE